jgi:segregation and condensation protein B
MLSPSLWRVFVRNWRTFFLTYILPTIPSDMNDTRPIQQSDPISPPEFIATPSLPDDTDHPDMIEVASGAQDLHQQEWQVREPQIEPNPVFAQRADADTDVELPLTGSQQAQLPVQPLQTESTGQVGLLSTAPETTSSGDLLVLLGETWQPLGALIESLLFVADKPVEVSQIARTLSLNVEAVEASLRRLADAYQHNGRGLRLQEQQNRWRLVTMPEAAGAVEAFLNLDMTTRLSTPALETLSVIAYRQPVTRPQIEAVRGVDCGAVLRSLIQRGLVEEVGRLESVGRPILYSVSEQFMHHFGLMSMRDLPPLEQPEEELLRSASDLASI